MHFPVAVADVHMDRFAARLLQRFRSAIAKHQVADIDVCSHARVIAFVEKADHLSNVVEQAEPKGLEFERDVEPPGVRIVTEEAAALNRAMPMVRWRNDLFLPDVLPKDKALRDVAFEGRAAVQLAFPDHYIPKNPLAEDWKRSVGYVRETFGW